MHVNVDDKGLTSGAPGTPNAQVCLQSDEKGFLDLLMNQIAAQ
jgi:hypothetical protein